MSKITSTREALEKSDLVDIGAKASVFEKQENVNTCLVTPFAGETKGHHVLANPRAFVHMRDFNVDHDLLIPTHAGLEVWFKGQAPSRFLKLFSSPGLPFSF